MLWKPVNGYEGCYEVSSAGDIRSLDRTANQRHIKGRTMKQSAARDCHGECPGYLVVNLRKDGKSKVSTVHRIVAEAFISNPCKLPTVNHIDGDKHNNHVENLEWASYRDNNVHALSHGLRNPRGVAIAQLDENGSIMKTYKSVTDASKQTGVSRGMISHCINGRSKLAGGYAWIKIRKCNDYPDNGSTAEDELPLEVQERSSSEDIVYTNGNIG